MKRTKNNCRILIVDDHPLSGQVVARLLKRRGFKVALVPDGVDALNWLDYEHFDAVLSDVEMPEMGGFELLTQIRRRHPRLPVILMTVFYDDGKRASALAWGAKALLKKPFEGDQAAATLRQVVRGVEMQAAVAA